MTSSVGEPCRNERLTRERVDGIKLEAEAVSGQFESGDPNLGEEVVELLGYLQAIGRYMCHQREVMAKAKANKSTTSRKTLCFQGKRAAQVSHQRHSAV